MKGWNCPVGIAAQPAYDQRMKSKAIIAVVSLALAACGGFRVIDRPVPFPEERVQLTRDYMRDHYGIDAASIEIVPRIVVLHWTAGRTFAGDFNTFVPSTLRGSRPDLRAAGELNVGIQFLVDRDGKVYRLMPETWMARHVIGLNYHAIGVENVGGSRGQDDLTAEQREANIQLVRYLKKKYPTIEYLIGHHEYRLFEGHPLWLERDPSYRTAKSDPGEAFMTAVRTAVADLELKGPAAIAAEKEKTQ
jgi:beta-N-acetylhexosaminidase